MSVSRNVIVPVVLFSGILLAAWAGAFQVAAGDQPRPGRAFVLNLTSGQEDLHAAWMGLQLAEHALNDGREVTLFLNVHAAELATTKTPSALAFQDKPPLQTRLKELTGRGAKLLVCPSCLEVLGIDAGMLIPGAKLASRESLFGALGPDAVVFSY